MFLDLARCGSIEDVELGIRWDRTALAREVDRRAVALAKMGIRRGAIVAIAHGGSANFFADLFAIWSVHATAACLDSALTELELGTVVEFLKPVLLLADRAPLPAIPSIPIVELAASPPSANASPPSTGDLDAPALLLSTSGTTGTPKVVVLSYRSLKRRLALNAAAIGRIPLRRALVTLPTHFGHGLIGNSLTPLLNGGDIVIFPRGLAVADRLAHIIDHRDISFLSSVPSFWKIATQSAPPSGRSLVRVHVGSAPLAADLWSQIAAWSRAEVINCYGMTETANWMAGASSRVDFIADGFVGRTWGGIAAVRSDEGCIREAGEGEIVVKSPTFMKGYLNQPALSAAVMAEGFYRTGDRGRVDEIGRIWLSGRIKDEINRAGFKIQPAEIDALLEQHPAVAEACAFAVPDAISGEAVGAAVRLAEGQDIGIEALRSWCRERLHRKAVPGQWFIVESIPRNARGKVNREAVRRMLFDGIEAANPRAMPNDGVAANAGKPTIPGASTPLRADAATVKDAVARAWISILGPRSYYGNLRWHDAGGESLGALHLLARIEERLEVRIPISALRTDMRPNELQEEVALICDRALSNPGVAHGDDTLPLVFLAPPAYGDVPGLAQFREALAGRIRFHVIQYPPLSDMISRGAGFDLLVEATVDQILRKCGVGVCRLAGYSFGGFVAHEAARRIVATGRRVDFLGLIDSRFDAPEPKDETFPAKAGSYLRRSWSQPGKIYRDGFWWLAELLSRYGPLPLLRGIDRLTLAFPASTAFAFRLELLTRLRANSLSKAPDGLGRERLDVPTTLFRAEDSAGRRDHGWEGLCGQLVVRAVGGGHRSLFEPPFRADLCAQFLEAVDAASRVDRSQRSSSDRRSEAEAACAAARGA